MPGWKVAREAVEAELVSPFDACASLARNGTWVARALEGGRACF